MFKTKLNKPKKDRIIINAKKNYIAIIQSIYEAHKYLYVFIYIINHIYNRHIYGFSLKILFCGNVKIGLF